MSSDGNRKLFYLTMVDTDGNGIREHDLDVLDGITEWDMELVSEDIVEGENIDDTIDRVEGFYNFHKWLPDLKDQLEN